MDHCTNCTSSNANALDQYCGRSQAARTLGVSEATVTSLCLRGKLERLPFNGRHLYRRDDVEKLAIARGHTTR
jgi:hypothetical protein